MIRHIGETEPRRLARLPCNDGASRKSDNAYYRRAKLNSLASEIELRLLPCALDHRGTGRLLYRARSQRAGAPSFAVAEHLLRPRQRVGIAAIKEPGLGVGKELRDRLAGLPER
jgi:hypothetical protein